MKIVNRVNLIGYLGKDPMIKTFESGSKKATIILATREKYRNSVGRDIESTQWHRLIAWGRTADQIELMLHKGTHISLEGRLHQYKVNVGEAGMRVFHEVIVDTFELLVEPQKKREVILA